MTTIYEKIQALGNRIASNLNDMGVSASFNDGALTLADKILEIDTTDYDTLDTIISDLTNGRQVVFCKKGEDFKFSFDLPASVDGTKNNTISLSPGNKIQRKNNSSINPYSSFDKYELDVTPSINHMPRSQGTKMTTLYGCKCDEVGRIDFKLELWNGNMNTTKLGEVLLTLICLE